MPPASAKEEEKEKNELVSEDQEDQAPSCENPCWLPMYIANGFQIGGHQCWGEGGGGGSEIWREDKKKNATNLPPQKNNINLLL